MTDTKPNHTRMVRKLNTRSFLTGADTRAICDLPITVRDVPPLSHLVREGETPKRCAFIIDGFAYRHKLTRDGARQIIAFHVPGDFVDLQHMFLRRADHNVQTLSACRIAEVPIPALADLAYRHPAIARAMWLDVLIEASIFREWIVNIGRRDARVRLAHLLCEFSVRLETVGLTVGHDYRVPMTQEQLSDALGLTPVHVNRVLRMLENEGLIKRDKRQIAVRDWDALRRAADFNTLYLHPDQARLG